MAAAVACGVKYSPLENFPHDLAIGVAHFGRIVRGEWRRVPKDGPAEPVADRLLFKASPGMSAIGRAPLGLGSHFDPNRKSSGRFCCAAQQSAAPSMAPARDGGEKITPADERNDRAH
jgi:hypothetical protein